jgi:hypothetical protein
MQFNTINTAAAADAAVAYSIYRDGDAPSSSRVKGASESWTLVEEEAEVVHPVMRTGQEGQASR